MPSKTITVTNGDGSTRTITIPDRSRFAGVRTISRAVNELPLTDATTSIQVTVAGHPDLDGIYTGSVVADSTWTQQGGNGRLYTSGYNSEEDSQSWFVVDNNDGDPNGTEPATTWGARDRPWNGILNPNVKITGIAGTETVTVDRTAPVITSDRKGASRPLLSKLVGGAAAAYSLRDLNDKAGNNKVVRVRRASDNAERDFLAKEVSNGTLKNWVNTQTVLPLDIQALTDDGRTGSVIPAKAAYSLRNLSKNYTGNVVDVRRSSDDTPQGFTAAEIADGTLLAFVNTPTNGVFADAGYESFTNASASGFTASNTGSTGFAVSDILDGVSGDAISVSFDIDITNGSPSISLRTALNGGSTASNSVVYTSSGSKTATLTGTKGYVGIGFTEGDSPSNFTVSNFKIIGDGHVSKWYDQSGDDNHAVQATPENQPKIVNAGSLVTLGLDFTGGKFMLYSVVHTKTVVAVNHLTDTANLNYIVGKSTGDGGVREGTPNGSVMGADTGQGSTTGDFNGTGGSTHVNGSQSSFALTSKNVYFGTRNAGTGFQFSAIGTAFSHAGTTRSWRGQLAEVILYATDQTDNRTAIEANIGEAYSITGIPAYDNTVDGFVETWYDQSGNGRDATQATAENQPKIVSAGVLTDKGIDFDGTHPDGMHLDTPLLVPTIQNTTIIAVSTKRNSSNGYIGQFNRGLDRFYIRPNIVTVGHPASNMSLTGTNDVKTIQTVTGTSGGFFTYFKDGTSVGTANYTGDVGGGDSRLGSGNNGASSLDGILHEIIVYRTDQSANRLAIEANINNQYDIY